MSVSPIPVLVTNAFIFCIFGMASAGPEGTDHFPRSFQGDNVVFLTMGVAQSSTITQPLGRCHNLFGK